MLYAFLFLIGCETTIGACVDSDGDGVGVGASCEEVDCDDNDPTVQVCGSDRPEDADLDADGFTAAEDCDDGDPSVHPDAPERCNGVDEDCDGETDEDATDAGSWYADSDGDGYGDPDAAIAACSAPSGTVADNTDCDDALDTVFPGAEERCNNLDDDCDSDVDEDGTDPATWYADTDQDGFGDPDASTESCAAPSGTVADNTDCDDALNTVFPGAFEICNDLDDDCDTEVDEDALDATLWYADTDDDTFGDPNAPTAACSAPSGMVLDDTDCDDALATVFPGADERCNNLDDDCDSELDEAATDATLWFADSDGDTYGEQNNGLEACEAPAGFVADNTDCDDGLDTVFPGADELCNTLDDDCDSELDENATDATAWFTDSDGDGFGDPDDGIAACSAPSGTVLDDTDCDDALATVFPGATEFCNTLDDDCDEEVDEDATDASVYFLDADGDGFGDPGAERASCEPIDGYSATNDDCNDSDADQSPVSTDYPGDGVDSDCDGEDLPAPDAPNAFYVSPSAGADLPSHGTRTDPFATIAYAISRSSDGDWLMLDADTYLDKITRPRNIVGSFSQSDGWSLDISQRSSIIQSSSGSALSLTLPAGGSASLSGVSIQGQADVAMNVSGVADSQLLLHNISANGRVIVSEASVEVVDSDLTAPNFALNVFEGDGNLAVVTNSTLYGDTGGAWIQTDAVLTDATFGGLTGMLLRPDTGHPTVTLTRVRSAGSRHGGSLFSVDGTITDSEFINTRSSNVGFDNGVSLDVADGSSVTVNRSRVVMGGPSKPNTSNIYHIGVLVDSSTLVLANSVVEAWGDGQSNSHAYAIEADGPSSVTVVNSTLLSDARGGEFAAAIKLTDGGDLTAINTALHSNTAGALSSRGLWLHGTTPTTLAGVGFNGSTDPLAFVSTGSVQLTTLNDLSACNWGSCDAVDSVLFEDLGLTDTSTGDVTPSSTGPLNNTGVDALSVVPSLDPELLTHDFAGAARAADGTWDIGAYELD